MTRVAAIDCGTNSIRLLVADTAEEGRGGRPALVDVSRRMEIVRLGQDVDRTGRLAPEALERTRVALARYTAEIRDLGADRVRLVATSATRDASNRDDFVGMVVDTLGVEPEVVTGDEEAALSFAGATGDLGDLAPPFLVCDIGGGSTELVLGTSTVEFARSMDIGCVRLTERYLGADPPPPDRIAAAERDIRAAVEQARSVVPLDTERSFVGVAGSVTTVVGIALDLPRYDAERIHHARVTRAQVHDVSGRLLAMTRAERAEIPVMHPGRVDVIGAGALVLAVVMDEVGADTVVASEHDILDGIALSLLPPGV